MDNRRKIKLDLTIALMNNAAGDIIQTAKNVIDNVKDAGRFLGQELIERNLLGNNRVHETHALLYENLTVDFDMVDNPQDRFQVLNGFDLR